MLYYTIVHSMHIIPWRKNEDEKYFETTFLDEMMVKKVISRVYVMQIYEPLLGYSIENYLFVIVKIQLATWHPCH